VSASAQPEETPRVGYGRRRGLAAFTAAGLTLGTLAGAPAAGAQPAGSSTAASSAAATTTAAASGPSLNDQAASLAARIRQQSRQADQLSEQADHAQIRVGQIADQLKGAQVALAGTSAKLAKATFTLAHQAVAAYTQGGRQPLTYVAGDTADDKSLINGYASALAGIQQRDVDAYELLRNQQSDQAQALSVTQSSAVASVEQLRAAQRAAQSLAAAEQRTLDNIQSQPQLTTLVASAETSQYQATATAVQARFASGGTATAADAAGRSGSGSAAATASRATGRVGAGPASPSATFAPPVAVPAPSASPGPAPVTRAPVTTTAAPPVIPTAPSAPSAPPSGVSAAIAYAYAQIGKPYLWGGAGPDSFDCSGLVMRAYATAGINFDHSAQDQYNSTARVAISALRPGDLVFFGTPGNVYHVGIYVGGGSMVDAPHTGADVRVEGIYWSDLLAGGRV
jgi:cell wall-associated NlpC family hydrolase